MRPLDGTLVVSLEHAIAAPFCTRQLADLGARVIKVERFTQVKCDDSPRTRSS
jgi:crotonobetainyl-CoA:carnitine CoA-transferase CaiB-like acyl-CoA transferase